MFVHLHTLLAVSPIILLQKIGRCMVMQCVRAYHTLVAFRVVLA